MDTLTNAMAPVEITDAHRTAVTGTVYVSRSGMNVIMPGTGSDGCGNHHFPRKRNRVADQVRNRIADVIASEAIIGQRYRRKVAQCFSTPAWEVTAPPAGRGIGRWGMQDYVLTVREESRGEYRYTVWIITD